MKTLESITVEGFSFRIGDRAFKKNKDGEVIFCGWITAFYNMEYGPALEGADKSETRFQAQYVKPFELYPSGRWGIASELIHESVCGLSDIGLKYIEMCEPLEKAHAELSCVSAPIATPNEVLEGVYKKKF